MFPLDTSDFAHQRAEQLRESLHKEGKDISPQNLARGLYDNKIEFGYWEAVQQGIWFRYPHEIQSQAECGEQAVYRYAVAKALGLKPRIFLLEGISDLAWYYPGPSSHLTVDVAVGDERVAVDPHFSLYGPVELSATGIYLKQKPADDLHPEKNPLRRHSEIKAGSIVQLSEAELIEQIRGLRKPKGLLKMLQAYPMLVQEDAWGGDDIFPALTSDVVAFNPENNMLTIFVNAAELLDHHSRWRRNYVYHYGVIESSDNISDIRVDMEGYRESQLTGKPELEKMPWITLWMEYRRQVLEKAGKSGRDARDTYLVPAVDNPRSESDPMAAVVATIIGLPLPAELKKLPETMQCALKRGIDFSLFEFDIDDIPPPTSEVLAEYISLKFPIAKFQSHLEKGDVLAERVREVL